MEDHYEISDQGKLELPSFKEIIFRDVHFSYKENNHSNNQEKVLSSFNLSIKTGSHIAIIGKSGSGKSTLGKLLLRFFDIERGEILFNEIRTQDISISSLRKGIAYVPAQPGLFNRSIRENLTIYNPDVSDKTLNEICELTKVTEIINELPNGLETIIGKDSALSSGQKQRILLMY